MTLDDVVAAIAARGVSRVYKLNEVPASAAYPYAVVGMGTPDRVSRTTDGQGADLHRVTVQHFGRDIDGVLAIAEKGDLDGVTIGGRLCLREVGTVPYRDPDNGGVLNILHTYRI